MFSAVIALLLTLVGASAPAFADEPKVDATPVAEDGFVSGIDEAEAPALASSCTLEEAEEVEALSKGEAEMLATGALVFSGTQRYDYAYEVLALVNQERAKQGLKALVMDGELLQAAMLRSAECSYFFKHTRPDGSACFTVSEKMNAENIAAGQGSPKEVVESWMASPGHRSNILSKEARSIGIGCLYQSNALFWVQCFSSQDGVAASKPANADVTVRGNISDSYLTSENFQFRSLYYDLAIGESVQGEARFINPGWPGRVCELDAETFSWRSENPSVASVDAAGTIRGVQGGATKIVASIGSRVSISVDAYVRLATPVASVKQSGSHAVVSWSKVPGAGTYQVFRGPYPNSVYEKLVTTTSALSFEDADVSAGETYSYSVRALYPGDAAGNCSSRYSEYCSITLSSISEPQPNPTPGASSGAVTRLWGATALDTMRRISLEGTASGTSPVVVVATMDGYWDALTASSVAGLNGCPILLTEPNSLSAQTASEIRRLGAKHVVISGGEAAVSKAVEDQARAIAGRTSRMAGADAIRTALETYKQGRGSWGSTAIVATSTTYHDALAASPYAYGKRAPIFLTNPSTKALDADVLKALREGGFTRVLICGGYAAVPQSVESSLSGMQIVRKGGATAYETSVAIAEWSLKEGLKADGLGVATATGYWDALAGAAFCGGRGSVLVLADDGNRAAVDSFVKPHKAAIKHAYVFGGEAAVSRGTYEALVTGLR